MQEHQLSSRDKSLKFKSTLKQSQLSEEDYSETEKNWKELNCRTMYDYTMKYLQIDVLVLADLFENFERWCFISFR